MSLKPSSTVRFSVVLTREKLEAFREAARHELGPMKRTSGDGACAAVARRLIDEYIAFAAGRRRRAS